MPLSDAQQKAVLSVARALIGTKYSDIDCSHFVHRAYATAGLNYPYRSTDSFAGLVGSYFVEVDTKNGSWQAGDVLLFSDHVGLWDPRGCQVLQDAGTPDADCKRFKNSLPFLSSRSGGNRGPDYGMLQWFGDLQAVYRWKAG